MGKIVDLDGHRSICTGMETWYTYGLGLETLDL